MALNKETEPNQRILNTSYYLNTTYTSRFTRIRYKILYGSETPGLRRVILLLHHHCFQGQLIPYCSFIAIASRGRLQPITSLSLLFPGATYTLLLLHRHCSKVHQHRITISSPLYQGSLTPYWFFITIVPRDNLHHITTSPLSPGQLTTYYSYITMISRDDL